MKRFLIENIKKLLILPPVVIGLALLYFASLNRLSPERIPEKEVSRSLRIIELQPVTVIPRATGFGSSQASQEWRVISEVKGRIVRLHPDLKPGSFIREGDLLLEIDPTDIQNSIQRYQAEIASSKAKLEELKVQQKNYQESLKIENQRLQVNKVELDRAEGLFRQNAISQAEVDTQRRSYFAQLQSAQNIKSSLNLIPTQIKTAEASISISEANLRDATRDLGRCKIKAPFTCRIGPVSLEVQEFVSAGQHLFTAQAINKIEVEARFSIPNLSRLITRLDSNTNIKIGEQARPQETLRKLFDIQATVRYGAEGVRTQRVASFERLRENLEELSRTIGVVVSIEKPYQPSPQGGKRTPPPVIGTFCEVELRGRPIPNSLIVPRTAINDHSVFVLDNENRLRIRKITTSFEQQNFAVVSSGLTSGDRVVVSDPTPAIEGMLVAPKVDDALWKEIQLEAMPTELRNNTPDDSGANSKGQGAGK